jgi:excisionase family DNA binding protein
MDQPSPTVLTLQQVASRLQISVSQVVTLVDAGKLRAFNTGTKTRRELRIKPEWIDEFVEQSTVEPPRKMTRPKEAKREILVKRFLKGVV